jgi:Transposase DDE domain
MSRSASRAAKGRCPQTFLDSLRHFLTPNLWKQARQPLPARHRDQRWQLQPLLFTLLLFTFCSGNCLEERFETARAFYVVCHPKRRRPGRSVQGFHRALTRLPLACLRVLAAGVRRLLPDRFARDWTIGEFVPLGCDGSRLECPRSCELETRLGQAGKPDSAPTLWVTALVHLRTGLLWAWRLGKGTASEGGHLKALLTALPANALLVADAGYMGYDLYASILDSGRSFLIRVSSRAYLYTQEQQDLARFGEGPVWYWPGLQQKKEQPPLPLRLIRVRGKKADVWLLTNVLCRKRLGRKQASQLYRWRWRNEGLFRSYKRTLSKVKLAHRTVRLVHREAEASLLAVQLLLAHGAWALQQSNGSVRALPSARRGVRQVRREIADGLAQLGPWQRRWYFERWQDMVWPPGKKRGDKTRRPWPRRKPHQAPKPPKLRTLSKEQKALGEKLLNAA